MWDYAAIRNLNISGTDEMFPSHKVSQDGFKSQIKDYAVLKLVNKG
jgi:hypothetical protein